MKKLLYINLIAAASLCGSASPAPRIEAHLSISKAPQCRCDVGTVDLSTSGNGYNVIDSFPITLANPNPSSCNSACYNASLPHYHDQTIATKACQASAPIGGAPNGTIIRSYSGVTGQGYVPAYVIGQLIRAPAAPQYAWKCPAGWYSNTSNQLGGITGDQRCKRVGGTLTQTPLPTNGTQLGSWGFSWGNEIWVYGTAANGGAPSYVNIGTPAVCKF